MIKRKALKLFIKSSDNFQKRYTIIEYNAAYEEYPYQIKKQKIRNYFDMLDFNK